MNLSGLRTEGVAEGTMWVALAGKPVAVGGDAMIGHQLDVVTAPAQFLRQRHGREEMASRAARHQDEYAHSAGDSTRAAIGGKRRSPSALPASCAVSASISPMPKAIAIIEVPP